VTLTTTHASGSVFALGTTTVTYTTTDAAGNTSTASFTVTVNDTENPSIIAPADVVFNANFGCQAIGVVLGVPSINDNCSISGVSNDAPPIYPLGNTTITWTISDNAGNTSTTTQLVTVVDNIAPSLTVPANLEVVANSGCDAINVSFGQATATDNCGIQSIVNNAPSTFPSGTTQVTWTATDNSGNQTSLIQLITVEDLVAPTAVLNDVTIPLPVGSDAIVTSAMIDGGSSDNCGGITFEITPNTFSCNDLGENKVTVTITDDFGNSTIEEITITVTNSGIDADFDAIDDACDDNINTTTATVPSGFTPDGDGINDLFVIPGMDNYTRIDLSIFNRYGNTVYSNDAYNNDWDGTSSLNGNELPDGTYFYVLELDSTEILTGYVYINRVK
jgi:gliding motility-associated-like protein